MPKKPFTAEEIAAQRARIMDSASQVMADVGFHHLSMRKLAAQLGMTASNIYNYFPNKEILLIVSSNRRQPQHEEETKASYERGFSFFSLYSARRDTPATFTTLKRTPGISPTA